MGPTPAAQGTIGRIRADGPLVWSASGARRPAAPTLRPSDVHPNERIPMQPTEREERFILACFEDGGGQGFDWRAAGERMCFAQSDADALARQLADRGLFHGLSAAGEGVFTSEGRALAGQVLKDKGKDPRYWTTEQRALLKAAHAAAGTGN